MKGEYLQRPPARIAASTIAACKGEHRHFMLKEIHEQSRVVGQTLAQYIDIASSMIKMPALAELNFRDINRVSITACGTAFHAGLIAGIGSNVTQASWSKSISPPNFVIARCRSIPAIWRSLYRNPEKPPIHSPRCSSQKLTGGGCFRLSTCQARRWRARARLSCPRLPARKSECPPPPGQQQAALLH